MEAATFDSLPDDLLVQVFGFLSVGDILNGVWRLNKRSNQVLRHSSTRVWMLSFATTWDHHISSLDSKIDWFAAAMARMRLELSQLDPIEPFSSFVNKLIEYLVPLTDPDSVEAKQKLAHQLKAAAQNRLWSAAVSANMKEMFEVHLRDRSQISSAVGADYVWENFANRRRWYVVSSNEQKSFRDISSIHRILHAHYVVYSIRGQPLNFQYFHEWQDGDSGTGFDHPRFMALYFEGQGIFSTRERAYNAATMLRAKCALLGLNPELHQDVEKASNISNQVIVAFLAHIGVYAGSFESRPDPLWKYELNKPFSDAMEMIAGARNKLRRDAPQKDFEPPTDGVPPIGGPITAQPVIFYDDLLKYVTVKPLETQVEQDEEPSFRWGRYVQQDELDSDDMPHSVALRLLPRHVKQWKRTGKTQFDTALQTIRSQLVVDSHLHQWFSFASEVGHEELSPVVSAENARMLLPIDDNSGLDVMKDLLQECEIIIVKTWKDMERDRGHGCRTTRAEFALRPKKNSKFQFQQTTLVFKFCVCRSTWGETLETDMIKLSVFEDSNFDVFSYSRKAPPRPRSFLNASVSPELQNTPQETSADEKLKRQAYRLLMLKKRFFNDQHAKVSAQVLLGALVAIGMSADCWRRDGVQIYRYFDEEEALLNLVASIFRSAMAESERASSASLSMDLDLDAANYAPMTNAERKRKKGEEVALENAKKLQAEQEKLKREHMAKNSTALRTEPLDFPLVAPGSFHHKSVKQVRYAPHLFLACGGVFFVDTSSWPPTFEASDMDVVHPRLVHPTLCLAQHRVSRRMSSSVTSSSETVFITNSLPFKLSNMQSASHLIDELNSAIDNRGRLVELRFGDTSPIPTKRLVGGRMFVGSKPKHGSAYPLLIETEPGALKFQTIVGIDNQGSSNRTNNAAKFRDSCRIERLARLKVVKMPTKNFPAGYHQEAIFTASDAFLIREGTDESAKLQALEQDGVTAATCAYAPLEGTQFVEFSEGEVDRLFQIRCTELFEILWDPAKPLTFRYIQIFTKGLPGSIKIATAANGAGILVTALHSASEPEDATACFVVRVPAPLDSFEGVNIAAFSSGASFITVSWPELGWPDAPRHPQLFWKESEKSIITIGAAPSEPEDYRPRPVTSDGDDGEVKTNYKCSKCRKPRIKGKAWIPKSRTGDGALCLGCYKKLDADTQIELSSELELVDLDALIAKTIIPFVLPIGKTVITKLPFFEIASKSWTPLTASSPAFPVREFKPRSDQRLKLNQSPVPLAFCRVGVATDPPVDPSMLSIVAGWESGANLLPQSHLVNNWKRYESIRDLLADNLGAIVFVCRKPVKGLISFGSSSSDETSSKASIFCFLDFAEKFSGEPQTIQLESAREGSYSSNLTKIDEILWIGVVDYDDQAANNHGRETLLIETSSFGF